MGTAPSGPIPNLSNSLFLLTLPEKENIPVFTFLVSLGLIVAIALGSIRIVTTAALALMCVLFPLLLLIVVPVLGLSVYYVFFRK